MCCPQCWHEARQNFWSLIVIRIEAQPNPADKGKTCNRISARRSPALPLGMAYPMSLALRALRLRVG